MHKIRPGMCTVNRIQMIGSLRAYQARIQTSIRERVGLGSNRVSDWALEETLIIDVSCKSVYCLQPRN